MALGGGTFITQNKVLPGAYLNFVSASQANAQMSDRGYVAMALELDWGPDEEVFTVTAEDFQKESQRIFGYAYSHEKMKGLRDLFQYAKTLYAYRLNSGAKAENTFAKAKYSGVRGNDLKIVISANVDEPTAFDVKTLLDQREVDAQTVAAAVALKDNAYVTFKTDSTLAANAGVALSGGTNKVAVTGAEYQEFLDKVESLSFHVLACLSAESAICGLFTTFTKRMREENGVKFQTVLYQTAADHEGIISLENQTTDEGWPVSSLIYWLAGAAAGCPVNKSNTNKKYNGEFSVAANYKQNQLEAGLRTGRLMFHRSGEDVRILEDINSLTTFTEDKSTDFGSNQTIRVLDQIGNDIAVLFQEKYLGNVPNDESGRISLWNDIVKHHQEMQSIRAIENFSADQVTVAKGDTKKSVVITDYITPTNAMAQLYMTIVVQ